MFESIIAELKGHFLELAKDQYATYMLQLFIENNADPIYYLDTQLLESIIKELKGHILELAKDQYGT